jgi:capsid portal protein
LSVEGRIGVAPVFFENGVVVVYVKREDNLEGYLKFYHKTDGKYVLKHSEIVDKERSKHFHKYSLVKVSDGVVFKAYGSMDIYHFEVGTWAKTYVTVALSTKDLI